MASNANAAGKSPSCSAGPGTPEAPAAGPPEQRTHEESDETTPQEQRKWVSKQPKNSKTLTVADLDLSDDEPEKPDGEPKQLRGARRGTEDIICWRPLHPSTTVLAMQREESLGGEPPLPGGERVSSKRPRWADMCVNDEETDVLAETTTLRSTQGAEEEPGYLPVMPCEQLPVTRCLTCGKDTHRTNKCNVKPERCKFCHCGFQGIVTRRHENRRRGANPPRAAQRQ